MWGQWEGHSTARPGLQGSAGGCQPLAVPSGAVARSWHSASLRNPRELLPRAASAGQEALTGPLCPWSCWIQGRSRGRAVPGENSWKMKPTNPGREHLEKETPQAVFINALIKPTIQISLWGWTGMAPGVATLPRGPFAPRALPQQHSHPQKPPHRNLHTQKPPSARAKGIPPGTISTWPTKEGEKALTETWRCSNNTQPRERPSLMRSVMARDSHSRRFGENIWTASSEPG